MSRSSLVSSFRSLTKMMMPSSEPLSYKELCDDPARCPLGTGVTLVDRLRTIYASWAAMSQNPLSSATLKEEVIMDTADMVGGVGVFVHTPQHPEGVLRILHGLRRHTSRGPHRGKLFAYAGDNFGIDIQTIEVNDAIFETTAPVTVYNTAEQQLDLLDQQPGISLVPPPAADSEGSTQLVTRKSMFIPSHLLPRILHQELTPRQALASLLPALESAGISAACTALAEFLMVASTATRDRSAPQTVHVNLGTNHADALEVIHARRRSVLFKDLPGLDPSMGGQDTLSGVASTLKEVRNGILDELADRRQDRQKKSARQTITERWHTGTCVRLLKMCGVDDWEDLPPLYHTLAGHRKDDGPIRNLLQDAVDAAAVTLRTRRPNMTVQHATALKNWMFIGVTERELGEGLLPFSITPPDQVSASAIAQSQANHSQNMDYSTIMLGSTSISASDAKSMRTGKGYIPADWDEAEVQLECYTPVLAAILGLQHPNVLAHRAAFTALRNYKSLLKQFMSAQLGPRLSAATIVYYFHLRHRNWFRFQWDIESVGTRAPPSLMTGLEQFIDGYNLSWLPVTHHIPALQKLTQPKLPIRLPPFAAAGSAAGGGGGATGGGGGIPENSGADSGSTHRTRVRNNSRDPRLSGDAPLAKRIKLKSIPDAMASMGGPPMSSQGAERCLNWHVKGGCHADCPRETDHVALPPTDANALVEWCEKAF